MKIDQSLLDTLTAQAKANPRLRQNNRASEGRGKARFDYAECSRLKRRLNYDLRTSPADNSQRMLNALEPGTVMPIYRHMKSSETIAMIRGKMVMRLFDDKGNITEEILMDPISLHSLPSIQEGECNEPTIPMVQIEVGQWHSLEVMEEDYPRSGVYPELVEGRRKMVNMSR